jgi:hypothetical protein
LLHIQLTQETLLFAHRLHINILHLYTIIHIQPLNGFQFYFLQT